MLTAPLPSSPAPTPGALPPTSQGLAALALRRWWPVAAATVGGGLLLDGLGHLVHLPLVSASAAGLAVLALWSGSRGAPRSLGPTSTDAAGWLQRLERLQAQFLALDPQDSGSAARQRLLDDQRRLLSRPGLHLAVVGAVPADAAGRAQVARGLQGAAPLTLHWSRPLPPAPAQWTWPDPFRSCELLIYGLRPPLMAADLRWLQALPAGLPLVLLVRVPVAGGDAALAALRAQLPADLSAELLCWPEGQDPAACLAPLAQRCARQGRQLRLDRQQRCLASLHRQWQGQLESLRWARFQELQQRTQWLVAAGVVAAPVPSLDLLVLGVANGLMVKEMAQLWECPWSAEQLRATAVELGKACLSLGVVEWTSQALAGLVKWHGATWLLGSAVQALSAAYLTRVVGRAMADTLARSVGVAEPDLERIRREAPLLVAEAAERERLNWQAFLQQGRQWLADQAARPAPLPASVTVLPSNL